MNTTRFQNIITYEGKTTRITEYLLIMKLHNDGLVECPDLSILKPQVMRNNVVEDKGVPIDVDFNVGEYGLVVVRQKVVERKVSSTVAIQMIEPGALPVNAFVSYWQGGGEKVWQFPQLESLVRLYAVSFPQ